MAPPWDPQCPGGLQWAPCLGPGFLTDLTWATCQVTWHPSLIYIWSGYVVQLQIEFLQDCQPLQLADKYHKCSCPNFTLGSSIACLTCQTPVWFTTCLIDKIIEGVMSSGRTLTFASACLQDCRPTWAIQAALGGVSTCPTTTTSPIGTA